jgi:heterotetrameric sarcosine oxidase delta subunit
MFLIDCPHCGARAQAEFAYERSLDSIAPLGAAPAIAIARLYARDNPCGRSAELWRHTHGCRGWLTITRDTASHAIHGVEPYRSAE